MAGGGGTSIGSGRRRNLDGEINLVPFIDLLSMSISFLLMTAVWMEVGSVKVKQLVGTEGPSNSTSAYEMEVKFDSVNQYQVGLISHGHKSQNFTVKGDDADQRSAHLGEVLQSISKIVKSDLSQAIASAKVTTKVGVPYGELVSVMDGLRHAGIVNLGVVPVRE